jgi:para-nitrobenzyl esterase
MVWFHGGGNTAGEGGSAVFDGTRLAQKGVTLVTVNYRLGVFGFLAHPALTAESPEASSGNYGLLDQIAALEWVRANIAELGGDPSRVTIFGQSAGSTDTCLLMASPLAADLFHRAIGQSGSCLGTSLPLQASEDGAASAHANGLRIADAFGGGGEDAAAAEALRAIDAETLQTTATGGGVGPIVDGWVIPRPPADVYVSGDFNRVPLLTGWMADETKGLQPGLAAVTTAEYEPRVRRQYGVEADRVLAAYAPVAGESVAEALFNMTTDAGMGAGARRWVRAVAAAGEPTWLYHFSYAPPVFRLYITDDPRLDSPNGPRGMGAYHSGDLAYVFDNVGYVDVGWDDYDRHLADVVSSYWVSFARTGDPNAEGLPAWPRYDAAEDELMRFGSTISTVRNPRADKLDLFDSLDGG